MSDTPLSVEEALLSKLTAGERLTLDERVQVIERVCVDLVDQLTGGDRHPIFDRIKNSNAGRNRMLRCAAMIARDLATPPPLDDPLHEGVHRG
jgi:hypothetical protein